jgi:hypothetical protein
MGFPRQPGRALLPVLRGDRRQGRVRAQHGRRGAEGAGAGRRADLGVPDRFRDPIPASKSGNRSETQNQEIPVPAPMADPDSPLERALRHLSGAPHGGRRVRLFGKRRRKRSHRRSETEASRRGQAWPGHPFPLSLWRGSGPHGEE